MTYFQISIADAIKTAATAIVQQKWSILYKVLVVQQYMIARIHNTRKLKLSHKLVLTMVAVAINQVRQGVIINAVLQSRILVAAADNLVLQDAITNASLTKLILDAAAVILAHQDAITSATQTKLILDAAAVILAHLDAIINAGQQNRT